MDMNLKINNTEKKIRIEKEEGSYKVWIDDTEYAAEWYPLDDGTYVLVLDNEHYPVFLAGDGAQQYINIHGEYHLAEPLASAKKGAAAGIDTTAGEDEDAKNNVQDAHHKPPPCPLTVASLEDHQKPVRNDRDPDQSCHECAANDSCNNRVANDDKTSQNPEYAADNRPDAGFFGVPANAFDDAEDAVNDPVNAHQPEQA